MFSMSDASAIFFDSAVFVDNINTVICRVIHILFDAGGRDKIVRFGKGYALVAG